MTTAERKQAKKARFADELGGSDLEGSDSDSEPDERDRAWQNAIKVRQAKKSKRKRGERND
jgi:hypothetical protein